MIPKIIHTFWGGDMNIYEYSFIDNWKKILLPNGYKINIWKPEDFFLKTSKYEYLNYCITNKFWAHASDYIRFLVLYEYGGFWLDTDIQVFKPFDELLKAHYIISCANYGKPDDITTINDFQEHHVFKTCYSCFGCEKGHPILNGLINEYSHSSLVVDRKGFEDMDVSAFVLRYMKHNNIFYEYKNNYEEYLNLLENLETLTEFNNDKITLLPSVMFDYRYAHESLHPLMFASHKHWGIWVPRYNDFIENGK